MTKKDLVFKLRRTVQLGKWSISMKLRDLEGSYYGQLHLLGYIVEHPGCTQKEMAEFLDVSKAAITKTIARMIANGLVQREVNENDERKYKIYCTEKGLEIHQQCRDVFRYTGEKTFKGFSDEELEQFNSYLDRIIENLETDYSRNKSIRELAEEIKK